MDEKTEDSICANREYLLADGEEEEEEEELFVSADTSCIWTSPEVSFAAKGL